MPNFNDPVGSGNPYYGSGFTNLDRYLSDQNLAWGAQQEKLFPETDDYSNDNSIQNWIIQSSQPKGVGYKEPKGPPIVWITGNQQTPAQEEAQPAQPEAPEYDPDTDPNSPTYWMDHQRPRSPDGPKGNTPRVVQSGTTSSPSPAYPSSPKKESDSRYPNLNRYLEAW